MVEIRNLKFQPLTLHMADSQRTVHLAPRGRIEIAEKDVSEEMRGAAQKGFIALQERASVKDAPLRRPEPTPAPKAKAAAQAETGDSKDNKERG